jgi:hypothetical protein
MEILIEGATVITMAPAGTAEAILIRDGRIAAVGSTSEVRAAASHGAARTRLDGAVIVPGLIDAHCHITDVGYLATAADCAQPGAPDIPAIQARLRSASLKTPSSRWVTGAGHVEYKLREGRHPTRSELDQAVPDRPAVLYHTSLHACVLNTPALREAGFEDGQPDPPGGALGRDDQGRLDGVVFERPMFALFERNLGRDIAAMSNAERTGLARSAGERLAAFGITSVCDADTRRDTLTAFAEADEAGALSQRVYAMVVHDETDWLETSGLKGTRSAYLTASAAKIWSDGGMSSRTAAIHGVPGNGGPAVRVPVVAGRGPGGGRVLRRAGHRRRPADRDQGRGRPPYRRRPAARPGRVLDGCSGARSLHSERRVCHAPRA